MALGLGQWEDSWSRSSVGGDVTTDGVDVATLQGLAAAGCRVALGIEVERLRVRALAEGSSQFMIEVSGEWTDAAEDDASAAVAGDAAVRHDLAALLRALPAVPVNLSLTILGQDAGQSWVRTTKAFVDEFERAGWFGFAQLLLPTVGRANRVLILDADDSQVTGMEVAVHGPNVWPIFDAGSDEHRVVCRDGDPRVDAPVPTAVMPLDQIGTRLASAATVMEAVAGALAWLWIADTVTVEGTGITVRLTGNRPIDGELPACPADYAASSVDLWSWSALSSQPARRQATRQAATLQAEEPADLYTRAGSIHDTAEFLFSLAQSGLVQEALAARRAARDSAVTAGRSAADRARAAARSAVDRVLVVVGAGIGVVLANKGDIIDRPVAFGLLGLAAALTIGAGLLAHHLDLPGAARSVALFKEELEQHAEVLSPRDIDAISELPSLQDGAAEVERSRRASFVIIGVALVSLVVLGVAIAGGHSATNGRSPTTATTTVQPTSSTPVPTSAPGSTTPNTSVP